MYQCPKVDEIGMENLGYALKNNLGSYISASHFMLDFILVQLLY